MSSSNSMAYDQQDNEDEQPDAAIADQEETPPDIELDRAADVVAESRTNGVIRLTAGNLHNEVTAAEKAVIASGIEVFQRGSDLVRPVQQRVAAANGLETLAVGVGKLSTHALIDIFSQATKWQKYDGRSKKWVVVNPSYEVAQVLRSREKQWSFPAIAGVIACPTLRPNGGLIWKRGYDPETRLYLADNPDITLLPAVASPTRDDAIQALGDLNNLLDGFPFADEREGNAGLKVHRAVALSGMITPVVRGAFSAVPLHAYTANTAGSGKSFLVDLISAIATGQPCPVTSVSPDENETDKRITGLLLEGYPVVSLDNVNGLLGSDLLAQAVERPLVRLRKLGGSDIIQVENKATIYATGNQMRVHGDMVRRVLVGELDAGMERPELRQFKSNPVSKVLSDRGRYVSACLIICRAYIMAGRPNRLPALASFEQWSDLVRSALVWLGCADPVASMERARADDPVLTELREMLTLWTDAFKPGIKLTVREVIDRCEEQKMVTITTKDRFGGTHSVPAPDGYIFPDLREALHRIAGDRGKVSSKRLAGWLRSREKRLVGQKRFWNSGDNRAGVAQWLVQDLTPPF